MPSPARLVCIVLEVEDELTHHRVGGIEVENALLRLKIFICSPDLDYRIMPNSLLEEQLRWPRSMAHCWYLERNSVIVAGSLVKCHLSTA
jgi:hypothetical protein